MYRRTPRHVLVFVGLTILCGIVVPADGRRVNGAPGEARRDPDEGIRRFLEQRTFGGKPIPDGAWERAKRQWNALPKGRGVPPHRGGPPTREPAGPSGSAAPLGAAAASFSSTSLSGVVWQPIGPSPIDAGSKWNGRVNSIAVNPNNPKVVFIGASGGGVWRTNDAGAHWTPLLDHEPMLAIGEPSAIAIDPNNTDVIYVGSSTRVNNTTGAQGAALNKTLGILKSTDGGGSWVALGSGFPSGNVGNATQFRTKDVFAIAVDPEDSDFLYLASSAGLFTSNDGGLNWTLGINGGGLAESLALDTSSPAANRVLFAGINGSGVRQSTDGGQTWTQVLSAATPAVAAALAANAGPPTASPVGIGKVAVALAPPASPPNAAGVQVVYVTIEGTGGTFVPNPYTPILGIFQTTDQGTNWTQRSANNLGQCQCFYTNTIAVDPASPGDGANDIVYWGGTNSFRSDDAAGNFSDITNGIHADSHAWGFAPQPSGPTLVYAGNDGGVWRSTDSGGTWTGTGAGPATINAGGLQVEQLYHMDVKRDPTASVTLGALQDNGTVQYTGNPEWQSVLGGDGLTVLFDEVNLSTAYSINNGGPNESTSNGDSGSWGDITGNLPTGAGNNQIQIFRNTLNVDPGNGGFLYFGGAANPVPGPTTVPGQLFQTMNSGGSWRAITSFAAVQNVGPAAVAPANSNNVVVATGSSVFVSSNALAGTVGPPNGVVFTNITRNLPGRAVVRVAFDPNDPTVIYAALSGFGGGHLFRTTINGAAWTDISPALDVPFDAIALDGASSPTTIYAGTDLGVARSVDGGNSWTTLDAAHFPNAPVTDLQINPEAGVLRASTYGRGVLDFAAASGPVISVNLPDNLQLSVCAGTTTFSTIQVFNVGTDDLVINSVQNLAGSGDFKVLGNPSTPVTISPNAEVDFTVQFTPTDGAGSEQAIIRISSNDPSAPNLDLQANATVSAPAIAGVIAHAGDFGDVCTGAFRDLNLTINNTGACDLDISAITSTSSEFFVPLVVSYPLVVHSGGSIAVPIRFQPTSIGGKGATIHVNSNDPVTPILSIVVSGTAPPGDIRVTGSTDFGDVCAGTQAEKTVSVCNVGACNLHVSSVAFNPPCNDFTLINNPFPATVSPDSCDDVVIRFTPTSAGPKTCTLVITSDDPDSPVVSEQVTANTPFAAIDVPPDQAFLPEVIQSAGVCLSSEPFPVSNTGKCNLTITNFAITADPLEYALAGLPSFPIILLPGHIAGEGNLDTVFGPQSVDRDLLGAVSVTYESDPVAHTTATVTRALCGEGVKTGARVLVRAGGVPLAVVEKIQLQRLTANRNKNQLDTQDVVQNATLQTVTPQMPCTPFQYHREYGTVSNPVQLAPGSYQVTAQAIVNGKRKSKSVGFDVTTCDFNPTVVIDF
jgi:hypothetical protein